MWMFVQEGCKDVARRSADATAQGVDGARTAEAGHAGETGGGHGRAGGGAAPHASGIRADDGLDAHEGSRGKHFNCSSTGSRAALALRLDLTSHASHALLADKPGQAT